MNCEHMDQLLLLYTGGDLEEKRAALVAAHLQACTQCARTADEYAEVNQLVREFEPPMFSQAVYAGIRRQVLNEIQQTSRVSAWSGILSHFFTPLIQPRAVVIAAAVLLVTLIAASYLVMHQSQPPQSPEQRANAGGTLDQSPTNDAAGIQQNRQLQSSSSSKDSSGHPNLASGVVKRSNYGFRRRGMPVLAATQPSDLIPATTVTRVEASADVSKTSLARTPIRMDMTTSNPNIRVIWFSSPSPASSKDTSKGI